MRRKKIRAGRSRSRKSQKAKRSEVGNGPVLLDRVATNFVLARDRCQDSDLRTKNLTVELRGQNSSVGEHPRIRLAQPPPSFTFFAGSFS